MGSELGTLRPIWGHRGPFGDVETQFWGHRGPFGAIETHLGTVPKAAVSGRGRGDVGGYGGGYGGDMGGLWGEGGG